MGALLNIWQYIHTDLHGKVYKQYNNMRIRFLDKSARAIKQLSQCVLEEIKQKEKK